MNFSIFTFFFSLDMLENQKNFTAVIFFINSITITFSTFLIILGSKPYQFDSLIHLQTVKYPAVLVCTHKTRAFSTPTMDTRFSPCASFCFPSIFNFNPVYVTIPTRQLLINLVRAAILQRRRKMLKYRGGVCLDT